MTERQSKVIEGLAIALVLLIMVAVSKAQEAPSPKVATPAYWTAVGAASGIIAADAVTTFNKPYPVETMSPWLYGRRLRPARIATIMTAEAIGTALLSYELKKHHSRLWAAPLAYMGVVHGRATIYNLKMEKIR